MSGSTPISGLPPAAALLDTDLIPVLEPGSPGILKSVTVAQMRAGLQPPGSFLPLSGGTLTGPLILAANPQQPKEIATKGYVDTLVGARGDGSKWSIYGIPGPQRGWSVSAFGQGLYIIQDGNGNAATSPDAMNWTLSAAPVGITSIAFANGLFVGVGSRQVGTVATGFTWTSTDGVHWFEQAMTHMPFGAWDAVTFGNGVFVACDGSNNLSCIVSPDGYNWTWYRMPVQGIEDMAFGNGIFVASGNQPHGTTAVSTDGIHWTSSVVGVFPSAAIIAFGNGVFVACAFATATGNAPIYTSTDGLNWTYRNAGLSNTETLAYGNGVFVMLEWNNSQRSINSPDGVNWIIWPNAVPAPGTFLTMTFGNGKFVAPSSNGWVAVSQ